MRRAIWMSALLVAGLAACGESTGPQNPEDVTFASSLGVDLAQMTRLQSGVYVQTTKAGSGAASVVTSSRVVLDYTLYLPDGSRLQGPARLPLYAATEFIPGFTDGILGMLVGESRKIVVPSDLAYGASPPSSQIPAHSVLVFEVTLVSLG